MKAVSAQVVRCCVHKKIEKKIMLHMHGIIPYMFDHWANPAVHLLLLKSSMNYPLVSCTKVWTVYSVDKIPITIITLGGRHSSMVVARWVEAIEQELFWKKWANPGLFSRLFSVFFKQKYNFYNQCENMSKCPSSIWHRDSNPRPYELESSPITTRPGLPKRAFLQHTFIRSLTPSSEHQLRDLQTGFH